MMVTDISRLTESPGPMLTHPQGGARYHPGEQIISHLNYALGPDGWDWEELDHGFDELGDQVWVRGKLTARFVRLDPSDEGVLTTACTKIERGWQPVKRRRSDNTLVNLGDDFKAADTDAMKRAARLLGVGLDAWEKDGGASREQRQAEFKYPNVQERFKAAAEYERLVTVASDTGYPHAEKAQGKRAKDLSDAELEGSIRVLRKWELSQSPEQGVAG